MKTIRVSAAAELPGSDTLAASLHLKRIPARACVGCGEPAEQLLVAFKAGVIGVPTNVRVCSRCKSTLVVDGKYTVAAVADFLLTTMAKAGTTGNVVNLDLLKKQRAAEASRRSRAKRRGEVPSG